MTLISVCRLIQIDNNRSCELRAVVLYWVIHRLWETDFWICVALYIHKLLVLYVRELPGSIYSGIDLHSTFGPVVTLIGHKCSRLVLG